MEIKQEIYNPACFLVDILMVQAKRLNCQMAALLNNLGTLQLRVLNDPSF